MSEFRDKLIAHGRGQASVQDVGDALQSLIERQPEAAPQAQQILDAARKAGMPTHVYDNLMSMLPAPDDETVFSGATWGADPNMSLEDAATRVGGDKTSAHNDTAEPTDLDGDETLVSDGTGIAVDISTLDDGTPGTGEKTMMYGDATQMRPAGTKLNSGDDPTDAPASADTRVTGAVDDATVFSGGMQGVPDTHDDATRMTYRKAAESDDDRTTVMPAGEEATLFTGAPGDSVATVLNPDGDATMVNPDDDKTLVSKDDIDEAFDILSEEALAAVETSREAQSMDSQWQAAQQVGYHGSVEFREGSLLRNRFILETKLGEGGMGAVWKGVDKLKQEARDRNPYVAIKLLQGDFKDHPEAFIALQRETSKQQRLAHPNIATVYDFDRDDATATVFMTMEVLSGTDLAAFIRRQVPPEGLDYQDAMQLIRQLGSGLAHAHSNELVHSDLKPGNCFVTEDQTVKLLDFGIARASKTKTDAEGETTVFDPGQLGALTPAYATIEMFDGMDPDPRDDIYAMAIIAYQLFTGKHPFGRKNAPKAEAAGMTVPTVAKLNKAQNKALADGLAFRRDNRTASVEEFLAGLEPKKSNTWTFATAAAVILALVVAVGWPVVRDMQQESEREEFIARLVNPETMGTALVELDQLSSDGQRRLVLDDQSVQAAVAKLFTTGNDIATDESNMHQAFTLLNSLNEREFESDVRGLSSVQEAVGNLYQRKVDKAFNPDANRYDLDRAKAAVAAFRKHYPELAASIILENSLADLDREKYNEHQATFHELMDNNSLVRTPGEDNDIFDLMDVMKKWRPDDKAILQSEELPIRAEAYVNRLKEELRYDEAEAVLKASLEYAADNPNLTNLRFEVETEMARQANQLKVAEIEARLRERDAQFTSLEAFQANREDLITLADLAPTSEVLDDLQSRLIKAFDEAIELQIERNVWNAAEQLLVDFAKLFPLDYLDSRRESLSAAEAKAGFAFPMTPERQNEVNERQQAIAQLLETPKFTSLWEIQLQVPFKELIALLPADHPALEPIRQRIADQYIAKAAEARGSKVTAQARSYIERGQNFHPDYEGFDAEVANIEEVERVAAAKKAEAERKVRVNRTLTELLALASVANATDGVKLLEVLKADATDAEAGLVTQAKEALAQAYGKNAEVPARREDWSQALQFVERGLELAPDNAELLTAKDAYEDSYQKVKDVEDFKQTLRAEKPLNAAELARQLDKVAAAFPKRYKSRYREEFEKLAATRFLELPVATDSDLKVAAAEVKAVGKLFGGKASAAAQTRLAPRMTQRVKALEASDVNVAASYLALARSIAPKANSLSQIKLRIPSKKAADGLKLVNVGKISAAQAILADVNKTDPDAPNVPAFRSALAARKSKAEAEYKKYDRYARAGRKRQGKRFLDAAMKIWADNPRYQETLASLAPRRKPTGRRNACSPNKAGLGTKSRATCWDKIGTARGPTLVVVPAGGGQKKPFAIGKLEVSVADYNLFCRSGGGCGGLPGDGKLPATGLSLRDAEAYASWLSKRSGAKYRLPTDAEWEHAALAGGKQPGKKNYNCTVKLGDQQLKGQSLRTALSGQQNGWGLINYIGNAKEWVRSGGGIAARGGAHTDPMSRCAISLKESHSGNADPVAGFRLVRELG